MSTLVLFFGFFLISFGFHIANEKNEFSISNIICILVGIITIICLYLWKSGIDIKSIIYSVMNM